MRRKLKESENSTPTKFVFFAIATKIKVKAYQSGEDRENPY